MFGAVWIGARFNVDLDTGVVDFDQITVPAELIFIDGELEFTRLHTSELMVVSNPDPDVVFEFASQSSCMLLSARWYRTKDLDNGPWTWVANDELPVRIAEIPADSEVGYRHGCTHGRYAGNRPVHCGNTNININNDIYARPSSADRVAQTRNRGT